jgi:hypothetical protein
MYCVFGTNNVRNVITFILKRAGNQKTRHTSTCKDVSHHDLFDAACSAGHDTIT